MDFQRLIGELKIFEGTGPRKPDGSFMLYKDSKGIWTIGYGYNIQAHGLPPDIVERLLAGKAMEAHKVLVLRYPWFNKLDPVRQRVLVDMAYNMGPAFLNSWPIFVGQLQRGEFNAAADNMQATKWARDVGPRRVNPLTYMMRSGKESE